MPWKVYFYLYLALSIFDFLLQLSSIPNFKFFDWLSFIETIFTPIGLYAFVYNIRLSNSTKNAIIGIFSLLWIISFVYYFVFPVNLKNQLDFLSSSGQIEKGEIIRGLVLNLPVFYAMYQLFMEKDSPKKSTTKKRRKS